MIPEFIFNEIMGFSNQHLKLTPIQEITLSLIFEQSLIDKVRESVPKIKRINPK